MSTSSLQRATLSSAVRSVLVGWLARAEAPWLLSAMSAGLWALCFERSERLLLPWLALVPLFLLAELRGRAIGRMHLFALGWLHGLLFWWLSIPWIVPTLVQFGGIATPLSWLLMTLLAGYLGLYHAFALCIARLARRLTWGAWFLLPSGWVLLERVREEVLTGFPWNVAGTALVRWPGVLESSSWLGAAGWSFVLLSITGLLARRLAEWLEGRDKGGALQPLVTVGAGVVVLTLCSAFLTNREAVGAPVAGEPVRIVQPNAGIELDGEATTVLENYQRLLQLSQCLQDGLDAEPGPRPLLVWPESAAWPYSWQRDQRLRRDTARLVEAGCGLLLNSTEWRDGEAFNVGLLLQSPRGGDGGATPRAAADPGAAVDLQRYAKNRLVPFGEFVPYADLLPFASQLARNAGSYTAGQEATLLDWRSLRIGLSICFEVTFAAEVAQRTRGGANLLSTITNDAWYGDSSAPWQHLRAARFRAAENRRPMVRAAITGVSAFIDRFGALEQSLGLGRAGVLEQDVIPNDRLTWYARHPRWVELVSLLLLLVALAAVAVRRPAGPSD